MKNEFLRALTLLWMGGTFFLSACDKNSASQVSIPVVELDCGLTSCNSGVTTSTALVFFSKSGCTNDFEIAASATANLSCGADGCVGTAASWIDSQGAPITSIGKGSYDLCVLVDQDGNSTTEEPYSIGDIVFEETVYVESQPTVVADGSGWRQVAN